MYKIQEWVVCAALAVLTGGALAEGAARKPLVMVDFKNDQALRLSASQAQSVRVPSPGGHALQITTEAQAQWPSVMIQPRQGVWDLSGYDAVEMDVRNPGDVPVRVLLCLNNANSDGVHNCNVESVTVSEHGEGVVVVPFGMWHGSSGHPLDLKKVVSVNVLLDKPGRAHCFVVDSIRAVTRERIDLATIQKDPFFQQLKPVLGRGVNLGNALEAPREGEWGVTLKESYFEKIRDAGFNSVRIPVRWSAHAGAAPPYRIDPEFFKRVDWAVRMALHRKLRVVLNMHHYNELIDQPEANRDRFIALWKQIAGHYASQPPELMFELLNEPNGNLLADKWNQLLVETLAVVRTSNPTREVVIGPVGWNGIGELKHLKLPEEDRHLTVTVHYYNPFHFTHQGASWVGAESTQWLGTKWMGTKAEQQAVEQDLDLAIDWAVKHHRPLYLGEFGAYSKADLESRARWTRFVAESALARKMSFAYWEFCSGFGVYDPVPERWIQPLKEALLPPGR
jgi:aryl-phospho-beta-D-glucosidase BglC (GH1 family)